MPGGQQSGSSDELARPQVEVSVVLVVMNERDNVRALLPRLKSIFRREGLSYEILVIDGNSKDGTAELAASLGACVILERKRGYAGALTTGLAMARGAYILTLDADLSHDPDFIVKMWGADPRRHRYRIALYAGRGGLYRLAKEEAE